MYEALRRKYEICSFFSVLLSSGTEITIKQRTMLRNIAHMLHVNYY